MVQLHGDDEQAVEDMLRWVYSHEDFDTEFIKHSGAGFLSRMMEGAIIADKYGIPSMEKYNVEQCQTILLACGEVDAVEFAEQAVRYPDSHGLLAESLPEFFGGCFVNLFKNEHVRALLAKHADIRAQLIEENFDELATTDEFRDLVRKDHDLARTWADALDEASEEVTDEPESKKRKLGSAS